MSLQLYFSPFACSLASRIALHETGQAAEFTLVRDHKLPDGSDYHAVNAIGQVPVLRTPDLGLLTEGPAILQYIADRKPESGMVPEAGTPERYRVQQWLNFVSTELHKFVFASLFAKTATDEVKAFARENARKRFELLSRHLDSREFLTEKFSIADAYLVTVLNWIEHAGLSIEPYPVLKAYRDRLRQRPSVAKAMGEEMPLLKAA